MNELRVDIGGSNRGFQIATEETKRMAKDLNRSLEQFTPQNMRGAQMMRDKYGKMFDEVKGSSGIGGLSKEFSGSIGEMGAGIMRLATGPVGLLTATFLSLKDAAGAAWATMKESFQLAREAGNLGVTTVGLQKVDQASEEQGIDPQEARGRLYKFTSKVGEAADGDKAAKNFFKDMGVEIDGRRMEEILLAVANAFDAIKDPAERAHKATELFGRGGAEMIPILKEMAEGAATVSDEATDAVLGRTWKKIHGFFSGLKDFYKKDLKSGLANLITGYTGEQGDDVKAPDKVKVQESPEEKEAKAKAAAKRVVDLAAAQKAYRTELEATANAQTRLALEMSDENDLNQALAKAEAAHDEVEALKLKTELLAKQKQISETTKTVRDEYDAKNKKTDAHKAGVSSHVDSLSSAGLFTSAASASSPVLEVNRQQLIKLEAIHTTLDVIKNKPDMWG